MTRTYNGWYQVAFERELGGPITPVVIGPKRLILVRCEDGLRAFDADCPHRGAHLGHGGRLHDGGIICPFHSYRIRLGGQCADGFSTPEHAVLAVGGMVFVRLSKGNDRGWAQAVGRLAAENHLVSGFTMEVAAPAELVIENAFDGRHFHAVHGIPTAELAFSLGADDELFAESVFIVPKLKKAEAPAQPVGTMPAPYRAVAYSPGLVAARLQGPIPYTVITAATDLPEGGCAIRLTLALPWAEQPQCPPPAFIEQLFGHFRRGLESDRVIWENLAAGFHPRWTPDDGSVRAFLDFVRTFSHE